MSAQSYLITIEKNTGLSPRALLLQAEGAGLGATSRASEIIAYFKNEHGLGHGHAATMAQILRHLDVIDLSIAKPSGPPPGSIGRLWLDGEQIRPR